MRPSHFHAAGVRGRRQTALERAIGVSRVARVTALDRTSVEVACAVRPGGHVLQVTNGKAERLADAEAGAVLEAAELFCAEQVPAGALVHASARELRAAGRPFVPPGDLGAGGGEDGLRLAWREGIDLASGGAALVPAAAVHVPPAGGPLLGPTAVRWTSNGMGAHPSWTAALAHALLEAIERDQLARALPRGWTARAALARRMAPATVARTAPRVADLCRRLERAGLVAHLFDLAPQGGLGLPVAGALLFDLPGAPVPLTAGYACRLAPADALHAALLEAAQSRLTDIHGAREDVAHGDRAGVEALRRACAGSVGAAWATPTWWRTRPPGRRARSSSASASSSTVELLVRRLRRAGVRRCVALDLAPAALPARVAKVVAPGLLVSGLL